MLSDIAIRKSRKIHFSIINIKVELQWHAFGLSAQRRHAQVRCCVLCKYVKECSQVNDPHLNEIWSPDLPFPDASWAASFSHAVHYTWAIVDILDKYRIW